MKIMKFKRDKFRNTILHKIFKKRVVYNTFSWRENFLGGHVNAGPIVIYGENAMHWAVNIETRLGYICFRLPIKCFDKWWPMYFYISPTGTPNKATFWLYGKEKKLSGY